MAQMDENSTPRSEQADDEVLRTRLLKRVAIAAGVVVVLLGGLVLFESMTVKKEKESAELARQEAPPRPIVEKPAEEKPAEPEQKAEAEPEEKKVEVAAADKEPEAEPELTEAPSEAPKPAARPERPLTVPARAHKAMIRPAEPVAAAPAEPVKEATAAPAPAANTKQPAPASRPIAAAVEATRQFLVQAGVFSNLANAEELRAKIEAAGIPARIEARVQVGPFANRQEAEQAREKMKSLGLDPGLIVAARK
jgi:DedD protein